jgi:hypothetical protein
MSSAIIELVCIIELALMAWLMGGEERRGHQVGQLYEQDKSVAAGRNRACREPGGPRGGQARKVRLWR